MSNYAISDIHGCFFDFIKLLNSINFSDSDILVLCGDYVDRGDNCYDLLMWMENMPKNVVAIRGNHEEDFIRNVELLLYFNSKERKQIDLFSNIDCLELYKKALCYFSDKNKRFCDFDHYSGINNLINCGATLYNLICWTNMFNTMPYYYIAPWNRNMIFVHAGYIENIDDNRLKNKYNSIYDFYLNARSDGYKYGGINNGTIIFGHTPTIISNQFCYTDGYIWHGYNSKKNCHYYNIDTGCYLKNRNPSASLSCLRLDDNEEFYI